MKLIFILKQYLNFQKVLPYALVFILSVLWLRINIIQQAIGSESQNESHISLKVRNQALGEVLKKITLDTGYKFKLNGQWSTYPVTASIENMPLHRGLKLILQGLNHAIIYESDKSIKIVVYGKVDSHKTDSYTIQPFSSRIQDNQQEPAPSPESSPGMADDSSEETDSSGNTEDTGTENEDSSDSGKEASSEETNTAVGKELDQDSSDQSENTNEQNEQENAAEDAPPESPQEQN